MVLVDTSAWIRALSFKQPYLKTVDALLEAEEVLRHDFVYGELLIGDRGGRAEMLATYASLTRIDTVPHGEVAALVGARKFHGIGLSWVDVHLLASVLSRRAQIYTADAALREAARRLGVLYGVA